MKTFEYQTTLNLPDSLPIPEEVASQLQSNQAIHVVLLVADSEEDADWARLTQEQFLKGYASGDASYDALQAG